ncbi:hypothetical protein [Salinicoccus roseus]|uniref:hypothetical protein n=1 Tax=Salinicoccus roseus TaxID=45670 RepID=UPI001EF55469|nr:hypothetical protein [Salinicoccus roseus]MCG7332418.1 hypothetical protein [Salinicoccus roseus]
MEKYASEQIEDMLAEKQSKGDLKRREDCMHKDIVKCFLEGKAHKYVCMECGFADSSRAAFFSYPQSDQKMG